MATQTTEVDKKPEEKKSNKLNEYKPGQNGVKKWIIAIIIIIAAAAAAIYFMNKKKGGAKISFETEKVQKATIGNSVTATGTIEAVQTVEVGTQVSGLIDKIYVDYNSKVKKGDVIAVLDRSTLESALNSAKASLKRSQAEVESAKATLQSSQAALNYQKANYDRYSTLYKKGLVSADEKESAYLSYRQAQEQVAANRESVAAAQQSVASAEESVNTAQTNLGYATITSPIDGTVISKDVEEGQTVASSYSTPTLFTIAKDLTDMRVIANVDEADIGGVAEGQRATFTVDAYPNETFSGTVTQVRQEATTENNVVTYEVVISAPNPDLKLKPGLTANINIYTLEQDGILSVPTKALRFTPTAETVGKGYKIVDCNGTHKVWVKEGNTLKAYAVQTGITNGTRTQITGGIAEGKEIITEIKAVTETEDESSDAESSERSPFAPGPKKNDKKK